MSDDDVRLDMDLSEGVLTVNLGVPIVIVCNKVDVLQHGYKAKIIQENIEFIIMHIRQHALLYSASVVFTSAKPKESKNLDILYQYIVHRLYDQFEFDKKPEILMHDSLFVPSGFDSANLINELCKGNLLLQGKEGEQKSYEDFLRP